MNRFKEFFLNMNDEEWENFSVEVLRSYGFIPKTTPSFGQDGGQDYLVTKANITYLVSCKHYIKSNTHVGTSHEQNIVDRLFQFNATGFIGFYSTPITSSLQERLRQICIHSSRLSYHIFTPTNIIPIIQKMDPHILYTFGLHPFKYYLNVPAEDYIPLRCPFCHKDILAEENIPNSIVGFVKCSNNTYTYVYGCKPCLRSLNFSYGFAELEQLFHIEWLIDWQRHIDFFIKQDNLKLDANFYYNKDILIQGILQRLRPQTEGCWCGIPIEIFP